MNDPDFVPDMQLPKFDLDALVAAGSQGTNKTSSQMSPFESLLSGSRSPGPGFHIQLDLPHSESSGPRGSPFGLQGFSSAKKPESEHMIMNPEDDVFTGGGDWGMEIDEDGNIIEVAEPRIVQDELELPPLPPMDIDEHGRMGAGQQNQPIVDDQGDIVMMEEEPRPEAETGALPARQVQNEHDPFVDDEQHAQQAQQVPARRKRKARVMHADEETQISRTTMREWQENYLENCAMKKVRGTTAAQAKANAMLLTFGLGLGNIGQNLGLPGMVHPLALEFSGDSLFTAFTGLEVPRLRRGTRRSATESIEDDEEQDGRRVRPRLGEEAEQGRGLGGDDVVMVHDEPHVHSSPPEVGREAQAAMSDHMSSAMRMPWNRGSSLMPGSAQKGRIPSSPFGNRGDLQDIARYSDGMSVGDFGFDVGGLHSQDDPFDVAMPGAEGAEAAAAAQQQQVEWLDIEGQNFLSFMDSAVRAHGERRRDDDAEAQRRWVAFDDLFVARETPRATAAQAFYHALCLATKAKMQLDQDGAPAAPYGALWIGLRLDDDDRPAAAV